MREVSDCYRPSFSSLNFWRIHTLTSLFGTVWTPFLPPPPFWERNHFLWKGDRERGRQRDRIGRRRKQGGWKSEKGMCGEIWRGIDSKKEMETKSVAEHEKRDMDR